MVLGLAPGAEPRGVALGGLLLVVGEVAVLVPRHGLVFLVHLEVGAGGVEEQQVHFEVEQVRDLAEDLFLELVLDLQQPVHRPVARVVAGLGQAGPRGHSTGTGVTVFEGLARDYGSVRESRAGQCHPVGGSLRSYASTMKPASSVVTR